MHFQHDYASIGALLDVLEGAGLKLPEGFHSKQRGDLREVRERRADLGSSIADAFVWVPIHRDLSSTSRAIDRYDRLEKVSKLTKRLLDTIEGKDNSLTPSLTRHFPLRGPGATLAEVLAGLRALSQAAENERAELESEGLEKNALFSPKPGQNEPEETAGDSLILDLGETYREFFLDEPRILQDQDRNPCGPFVAFVMAVRRSVGDPITADGVKKAWDRARDKRRKNE